MRLLTTICALALVLALCVPAFAETQNVKVSGDISVYHVYQRNLDLNKDDGDAGAGDTAATNDTSDSDNFFAQQVGLNVSADLTDNVSTYVRLINERDWTVNATTNNFDVELDQAYATLREVLYAPLTLKIGRQDLFFGRGLIIGSNATTWNNNGELGIAEYSDHKAFDAVRATLDYDPWTIDLVCSKIDEDGNMIQDDTDLYGLNIGYLFDKYQAEAEAYVFHRHDQSNKPLIAANTKDFDTNECTTWGARGSFVPYESLNMWVEAAAQTGKEHDTTLETTRKDREAYLLNAGGDYTFTDIKWDPMIGLEYLYLSGEPQDNLTGAGQFEGWDPMYRGRALNIIRDFMDNLYNSDAVTAGTFRRGRSSGQTNQSSVGLSGGLDLLEDLALDAKLSMFWAEEPLLAASSDKEIGQELDGYLTYDYTEDVEFKLAGGVFWPDKVYEAVNSCDDMASKVVSSVKVEF
ncbi:MAG: alginate export family protein [Candidatus Omnitrophota bacterium]